MNVSKGLETTILQTISLIQNVSNQGKCIQGKNTKPLDDLTLYVSLHLNALKTEHGAVTNSAVDEKKVLHSTLIPI